MSRKIAVLILALAGAIFVFISLPPVIKSVKIKKSGIATTGEVTGSQRGGNKTELDRVTVIFTDESGKQVIATALKRKYAAQGDEVKLWYLAEDPGMIDFGDTTGYNLRAVALGGIFSLLGFFLFLKYILNDAAGKKLVSTGMKIAADISIVRDERFRAGDKNPYIIKAKWTDNRTKTDYQFSSKLFTIDPTPYLAGKTRVDVYIKPDDPSRYYMDTSFMPEGNNTIG